MANSKELRALITLAGKIDPSLQSALLKASGESLKLSKNLEKSGKSLGSIWDIAKGSFIGNVAANAFSNLSASVVQFGKNSLKMASDLTEVQNVVDTTFGLSAVKINEWSKQALKAYGLSELQAKQYTGTLGAMLKSSGVSGDSMLKMSQNLTALAGDFASFYNLEHEAAFEKIRSGISGETEPLKQLGINMSVANLEAFALSKGITTSYSKMDQASQTLLRYNYLMEVSKDSQGDFAKTTGEYANQQRLLTTNLQQAGATIAEKVLPYLTNLYQSANNFVSNVDISGAAEKAGRWLGYMGDAIKWVYNNTDILIPVTAGLLTTMAGFKALSLYNALMKAWRAGTIAATIAQWGLNAAFLANPITWIIVGIGALVAAVIYLWKNWDRVSTFFVDIWQNKFIPVLQGIEAWFLGMFESVVAGFKGYVNIWISIANFLISSLNKIKFTAPDWVPFVGGKNFGVTIPLIPKFAAGGIATGPSIFGEAGPEMAIPLHRTSRSLGLLNQASQMLGAGGNEININIQVYAPDGSAQSIATSTKDAVAGAIEQYFEGKARVSYGY